MTKGELAPRALRPPGLVWAALFAVLGAFLGRLGGPLGVAGCALLAIVTPGGLRRVAICALPAALMAWTPDPTVGQWPRSGPVAVDAVVRAPLRRDRPAGLLRCTLQPADGAADTAMRAAVILPREVRPDAVLPGDRLRGSGFLEVSQRDLRDRRPPRLRTELDAIEIEPGGLQPGRLATALRLAFEDALMSRLRGDAARLCCHLVLGDGPPLPDHLIAAHRATGLAHLLAVSGAHASMLAWLLGLAYRAARQRDPWSARGYRRVCGAILIAYGAITGWEPPVFRALVAFLVAAWATARGRRATIATALALPALLTAWIAPEDLTRASFWLSYAAVIGLSAAGAFGPGGPWRDAVRTALRASAWTLATTAPLSLYWFGQLAPWTVVGTPLCAPLVAAMLGLGLIVASLGVVLPPVADALAPALQVLADLYAGIVAMLALLPATPIHAPWRPPIAVLIACAIAASVPLALRPTRRRLLLACVGACVPFFVPLGARVELRLTVCDVGHGQACVVALGANGTAVIDCGAHASGTRAVRRVIEALPARQRIDVLVLSHADADHTGGVQELLSRAAVGLAVLPIHVRGTAAARALRQRGVRCAWLEPGQALEPLPGLLVSAPHVDLTRSSDNDLSLWVRVTIGQTTALLPGDAESRAIASALAEGLAAPADLLMLPHHGRGPEAANARLIERVEPRLALCSHGDDGEAPLMALARRMGVAVIGTACRGRVDVQLGTGGGAVTCEHPEQLR